jgi:hypothetical protein
MKKSPLHKPEVGDPGSLLSFSSASKPPESFSVQVSPGFLHKDGLEGFLAGFQIGF